MVVWFLVCAGPVQNACIQGTSFVLHRATRRATNLSSGGVHPRHNRHVAPTTHPYMRNHSIGQRLGSDAQWCTMTRDDFRGSWKRGRVVIGVAMSNFLLRLITRRPTWTELSGCTVMCFRLRSHVEFYTLWHIHASLTRRILHSVAHNHSIPKNNDNLNK